MGFRVATPSKSRQTSEETMSLASKITIAGSARARSASLCVEVVTVRGRTLSDDS